MLSTELHTQETDRLNIVCRERLCGHEIFIEKPFTGSLCASGMLRRHPIVPFPESLTGNTNAYSQTPLPWHPSHRAAPASRLGKLPTWRLSDRTPQPRPWPRRRQPDILLSRRVWSSSSRPVGDGQVLGLELMEELTMKTNKKVERNLHVR